MSSFRKSDNKAFSIDDNIFKVQRDTIDNVLNLILKWSQQNIPFQWLKIWIEERIQELITLKGIQNRTVERHVQDFKILIDQLKKTNQNLDDGIQQFTRTNKILQNQINQLRRINQDLGKENQKLHENISRLKKDFNEEKARIHQDFHNQFNHMCHNLTKQKNQLLEQLKSNPNLDQKIVELNQNYMKLVVEYNKVLKREQEAEKKTIESERQLKQKLKQQEVLQYIIHDLQGRQEQTDKNCRMLHEEINLLKSDNFKLYNQNLSKKNQQLNLANKIRDLEQRLSQKQALLKQKNNQIELLRTQKERKNGPISITNTNGKELNQAQMHDSRSSSNKSPLSSGRFYEFKTKVVSGVNFQKRA